MNNRQRLQAAQIWANNHSTEEVKVGAFGWSTTHGPYYGCNYTKEQLVHAEAHLLAKMKHVTISSLYVTKAPCADCAKLIIDANVSEVVMPKLNVKSKWYATQLLAIQMFNTFNVKVRILL